MRTNLLVIACLATAAFTAATASAHQVGACVSNCSWVETDVDSHDVYNTNVETRQCAANGNVAIINGDNNHVNYCSQNNGGQNLH